MGGVGLNARFDIHCKALNNDYAYIMVWIMSERDCNTAP